MVGNKEQIAEDNRTFLQKLFTFIPNDYLEKPRLVKDEEFAIHEPKVGRKFAALEVVGKFCTITKYFSILTCITVLISLTLFRGADISYSITDPDKLTYNFTVTLLQDPEVQNLKCPTSKNDLVLGDFTTFTFGISDVCRLISEDLSKSRFQSFDDLSTYSQQQFEEASDYLDDYEYSSMYYDYNYGNYNGDYNYDSSDNDYYYDDQCVNHDSCQTGEYCDAYYNCYNCDYYSYYGGIQDSYDRMTPGCENLSPPSPPPPPPSPPPEGLNVNGACTNHNDCTTATHYCDGGYTCWPCETYYYYGGVFDTYDDSTPACFSYTAPSPPPSPPPSDDNEDCWWCFWSTSSNQDEVDGDDSDSTSASVARKEKYASRMPSSPPSNKNFKSTGEVPPSPPPKKMNATRLKKFRSTGRVRTPTKVEDNCGPNQDEPCLYASMQAKLLATLGTYSFCRSDDDGRTTPICKMVEKNCEYSKTIHAEANLRLKKSLLPFSSLADENLLQLTVTAQKENVVQAMTSGLKSPESIVKQWSSANLPRFAGFINVLFTAVRGLRFRQHIEKWENTGNDTNFTLHVTGECDRKSYTILQNGTQSCDPDSQVGDGICQDICNIPECLYDGGDCLSLDLSKNPNEILNTDENGKISDFRKYKYRGMSQLAWENSVYSNRNFGMKVNNTFDSIPNEFEYFDKESVCGDPDTWYDYHGVDITDESNPSAIITSLITDTAITNYLGDRPQAQLPPQPSVAFPLKKKMWYSCDNFRNILAPSPYAEELSVSDMEAWIKWTEDMVKFVKDKILPGNLYTESLGENLEKFENYVYYPLKYARVVKLATENSGSFYALNLDASLSKLPGETALDRSYNVSAVINYKKYFENSGLLSCTYTKKFKIEPSAVVAVVVGIIGGVTSGCTFLAQILYLTLKIFTVGSARQ